MKTSFVKTFKDITEEIESQDLIHPEKATTRLVAQEARVHGFRQSSAFFLVFLDKDHSYLD